MTKSYKFGLDKNNKKTCLVNTGYTFGCRPQSEVLEVGAGFEMSPAGQVHHGLGDDRVDDR